MKLHYMLFQWNFVLNIDQKYNKIKIWIFEHWPLVATYYFYLWTENPRRSTFVESVFLLNTECINTKH